MEKAIIPESWLTCADCGYEFTEDDAIFEVCYGNGENKFICIACYHKNKACY